MENEDSLIDFIHQIFSAESENEEENNICINKFYSYVDFSELSEEALKTVLNRIDHEKMPLELWNRICECFKSNIQLKNISTANRYTFSRKNLEFNGDSTKSFEGIIAYLTKQCNGNVHEKGVVDVSATSVYSGSYPPKFAVDFNDHVNFYCSQNAEDSSICYDFKDKKVQPSSYSIEIRLINSSTTHHHPINWVIEGSNDKANWKILDSRNKDNSSFDVNNIVKTFKMQTNLSINECFQYIRLRQTGKSSANSDYLSFTSLEYFGYLYEF